MNEENFHVSSTILKRAQTSELGMSSTQRSGSQEEYQPTTTILHLNQIDVPGPSYSLHITKHVAV